MKFYYRFNLYLAMKNNNIPNIEDYYGIIFNSTIDVDSIISVIILTSYLIKMSAQIDQINQIGNVDQIDQIGGIDQIDDIDMLNSAKNAISSCRDRILNFYIFFERKLIEKHYKSPFTRILETHISDYPEEIMAIVMSGFFKMSHDYITEDVYKLFPESKLLLEIEVEVLQSTSLNKSLMNNPEYESLYNLYIFCLASKTLPDVASFLFLDLLATNEKSKIHPGIIVTLSNEEKFNIITKYLASHIAYISVKNVGKIDISYFDTYISHSNITLKQYDDAKYQTKLHYLTGFIMTGNPLSDLRELM